MQRKAFFFILCIILMEGSLASLARVYGRHLKEGSRDQGPQLRQAGRGNQRVNGFFKAPNIRVRVQKSLKNVLIAGTDLKRKFHLNNDVQTFKGRKSIKFKCQNLKSRASFDRPILLASLGSSTGLISLKEERYKGLLHIVTSKSNDSCDVIHETNLETYISSLLAREMNSKWSVEALKAQAVAARSYALHKMNSGQVRREAGHETYYHIESSEKHQVSGNFFDVNLNTELAAFSTSGEVLTNNSGDISPIFFHAKCGGKTLRPAQVWQNEVESYKSVPCPYCKDHGKQGFDNTLTLKRWNSFLKWSVKKGHLNKKVLNHLKSGDFKFVPDKKFSRKVHFYLNDELYTFKKTLLRRYFGRYVVPSNNFKLTMENAGPRSVKIRLKGDGLGHGVGMCQLGALDLADRGWDYKKILGHYFPGHKLKKIY